nr:replication factor A protein 1-like [Ipomoea batatas]
MKTRVLKREVAELVVVQQVLWDRNTIRALLISPELEKLIGMAMIFKIGFKKDQQRGPTSAFIVMILLRDELLVDTYCSRLTEHQDKDLVSKMIEEDGEDDEDSEQVI